MLRYNKNEPFQKLRDLIFSYFIAHPNEANQFKTELNNLREAEDFYDFVIPSIQHRKFDTTAKFTGITKDGFCSFDWNNKTLNIPTLDKNWASNYYVPSLIIEQLPGSPHRYMNYKTKGKVLVDCGAAEGFFALDNIEGFEKIVLIDGDQKWIKALKKTFEILIGNQVELIESFITSENFDKFEVLNTPLDDSLIKLDIEGFETDIISQLLYKQQTAKNIEILVCCYHKQGDFEVIKEFAEYYNFNIDVNPGWMLFVYDNLEPPFFRRGVVRLYK